ncbi:uncharacterized protein LOC105925039 isoform X2 [Fundulus heteroclitus]|uniref:uncharacterized protein LOC105925039 isoform X2 n=1 Tax=Fundulus heteroclitus TaxID=8078 RepID=UPI00165C4C8B|nr:uncharacterized protein LOC105925039 isoform X2 [Fundulus heteroclitus]
MSEMMKVEAEEPGGLSLVSSIPAASSSDLELTQDDKDLIRQMLVIREVSPDWSPSSDQENPEPPHVKEEEEELWTFIRSKLKTTERRKLQPPA